ncbi:hypothetical protein N9891_01390 [bacterium]|nr:hypothetical protein [bacterium]
MKPLFKIRPISFASLLLVPSSLWAMPLVSESFDYDLGTVIPGQGGETDGWAGAWVTSGGSNEGFESVITGLTFGDLAVSGGASQRTARFGTQAMSRTISATEQTALTADGSTMWFSVLMQGTVPTDPLDGGGFATNTFGTLIFGSGPLTGGSGLSAAPITAGANAFGVGFGDTSDNTGDFTNLQIQGVTYTDGALTEGIDSRVVVGIDNPVLVVGSVDWAPNGSDDVLNLYLITDLAAPLPEPFVTMIDDFDQSTFNVVSIGDSQTSVFDEIRFGLSLNDIIGGVGGGGPLTPEITNIDYDGTSDPGNIRVTITFASELGSTYTAFVGSDLETLLSAGVDFDDQIVGEEGSTTFVIDFDEAGFDTTANPFFIVVSENLPEGE